ncbi:xanthine phosphoribosyltransferase [Clostridiales bacterium COT073_COT-073]|nr:xanthine phosphoribosyltransferase [Clostridiales bacterium COT073_COT-073]
MKLLKERIREDAKIVSQEVVKVDSFINHQIDVDFLEQLAEEFYRRFKDKKITKILTIEASGIAIAILAAQYFKVPVVFAKKTVSRNLDKETYRSKVYSFTKQKEYDIQVSARYLNPEDHILILDDFLANGKAALGLVDIVEQSGAQISGLGFVIEKGFQEGGKALRKMGFQIESLAIIKEIKGQEIIFEEKVE